jgi:TonB-dependent starch-binding outer membrane protein SusC
VRILRQSVVLAGLLALTSWSSAQAQGSLTGIVTDAQSRRPLSSAQVFIVGSGFGGLTNASGRFLIANVPAGQHTLRVELIGFTPAQQAVSVTTGQATSINLELREEALSLDEIVVTGTAGQARRREVGNQIAQVKVADVAQPLADMGALLQGRMAGARVQMGQGSVGSGADIRLRGNVSFALSNQPLIYIDGQRAQSEPITAVGGAETPYNPLNDLNPDDIERVEVVKGPAATTLYGTEAAAGVIQIFTKRGGQGAPVWTAEVQQGFAYFRPLGPKVEWLKDLPEVGERLYDHARYTFLDGVFCESPLLFWENPNGAEDFWNSNPEALAASEAAGQTGCSGHRQRYTMSVQGGTPDLGYFVSGAYHDNQGAVESEFEERFQIRANTTFRPNADLLVQFNNALSQVDFQQAQMGNSVTSIMMTAVRGPLNYMSKLRDPGTLRLLLQDKFVDDLIRVTSGVTVTYTPGSDFTHRLTLGYDYANDNHQQTQPYCWLCPIGISQDFSDFVQGGELWRRYNSTVLKTLDYVGTMGFNLPMFESVRSTLSFGAQGVQTELENGNTVGRHFPGPGEYTLSTAATRWDMAQRKLRTITGGFFGQNQFGIADRYFLTVGLRVDGNSAFGENLGFQFYPKVSGSWVASDEGFWPESFGQMKVRGAFGFAGRAPGAFDKVRTWTASNFAPGALSFSPANSGNPDLGPERTNELELGFDAGWFDGRVSADVTYFRQTTTDALFELSVPDSNGDWNNQLHNVGKIRNQGFEINTNSTVINTEAFRWELGLGLATTKSTVLDLGGAAPFSVGGSGWVFEGQPLPVMYDYRLMNPWEKADPVFHRDPECLASGRTNCPETRSFFGPTNPPQLWNASTTFGLPGGISLTARGEMSRGGWIANNFETSALSRGVPHVKCYDAYRKVDPNWVPGGPSNTELEFGMGPRANSPNKPATRPADMYAWEYVQCFGNARSGYDNQHSDYFELREVTLTLPVSQLLPSLDRVANRIDMTLSGRNLYKWLHRDMTSGHPEQDENDTSTTSSGEWRHDFVRSIAETLPPSSMVTLAVRAVF